MNELVRLTTLVLCVFIARVAPAQTLAEVLPVKAMHCALREPPAQAGIAATPGGFVMVYPRNAALTDTFTGCKLLWIVDGAKTKRFATLYFKNGQLAFGAAHDSRDELSKLTGACAFPEGKSLLLEGGRATSNAGCAGFADDSFYALRVPTWPRSCLADWGAAACVADPR